jgi:hypothetical protein
MASSDSKASSDLRVEDVGKVEEKGIANVPALDAHYDPEFVARTL